MLCEEDVRRVDDGFAQRLLANTQFGAEQVAPLQLEQVESDECHRVFGGRPTDIGLATDADALLHAFERWPAIGIENHELAVDDGLAGMNPGSDRLSLRVSSRLVTAAPARDADEVPGHTDHRADTVVFQLEQPSVPGKGMVHRSRKHRRWRLPQGERSRLRGRCFGAS